MERRKNNTMKRLTEKIISATIARLCVEANTCFRKDMKEALVRAINSESNPRAKSILKELLENAALAKSEKIALCQDTGLPVVFAEIGCDVDVRGLDLNRAINKGVEEGYRRGYLRESIVSDPLDRRKGSKFSPCIIHFDFGLHKGLRLTVLPKGFGCENKTQLKMFVPNTPIVEIKDFIVSAVKAAGPDACPPYVVGVGIGGSADYASLLSKKALLRHIGKRSAQALVAGIEKELLADINKLDIGPMGLGGKTTAFGVNILTYPTHIAGLPVVVNISCHVLRSAGAVLR
jgi:fumarate hydratase subunit alpha